MLLYLFLKVCLFASPVLQKYFPDNSKNVFSQFC